MKKLILSLLILFSFLFIGLQAQNCQAIIAEVVMTDPPVFPADTGYIDVCVGEVITFSASATFPENDLSYHQDIATSTFKWVFGDFSEEFGQTVQHAYNEPGGYRIRLFVRDEEGCTNDNDIVLRIRVAGIPEVNFEPGTDLVLCQGDTLAIQADYPASSTFIFESSLENNNIVPLPDGTGAVYETVLWVNEFEEGLVVSDTNQIEQVCLTIEHSWMHDLEIFLTCPDGTQIILQNQEFVSNEVFLGEPSEIDDAIPVPGIGYTYCWTPDANTGTWTDYSLNFQSQTLPEGDYNSFESLDNLFGCPLNGDWALGVRDLWASDNGFIFGWSIQFGTNFENEPPFSADIVSYEWSVGATSTILSETDHSIEVIIADSSDVLLTLTDSRGCSEILTVEIGVPEEGGSACQPCNTFVADAGPDLVLTCVSNEVVLDCSASTAGDFIQYTWFDESGNPIGTGCNVSVNQAGLYILEVRSLANDCIMMDTVAIVQDVESPIADAGTGFYISCSSPSVQLGGGNTTTGPNISYSWTYNGVAISDLLFPVVDQVGLYGLEVVNLENGCISGDVVMVSEELLLGVDITTANCGVADGGASVNVSPAIQNPQVDWSTGDSGLQVENLPQGWYSVTITDDTCTVQENFYVDEDLSCKVQIGGYVYNNDIAQNCLPDVLSFGEECVLLHLMPLDIYTYSDPTGFYNFVVDPGIYTLEILPAAYFELLCPASPLVTIDLPDFGTLSQENDFYLKYAANSYDLSITNYVEPAVRGFEQELILQVCNNGEAAVDATITLTLDSLLMEASNMIPLPQAYDPVTNTLTWIVSDFQPGLCIDFQLSILIPTTIDLGTLLHYSCAVNPIDLDVNSSNNNKEWALTVVGAYDPNDKQVLTGNNQFGGPILRKDSVLQYQLRFQNVGTAPAQTVVIRDTLDTNLDVTSIRAGASSHDYVLEFEGNNVLIFRFDGINLPDSTSNEAESQGHVSFSIELKDGLPFGTEIQNSAAIFFDFNEPVITNTVINTLVKPQLLTTTEVEICPGEEYEGIPYFESVSLADTLDFIDFDSVYITEIEVLPVYQITIDTVLQAGDTYEGMTYESDTSLVQNLLSIAGCDSTVTVNIEVIIVNTSEAYAAQIAMELYPNPVKETLQIQYQLPEPEIISAYIYDVFGQKVRTIFSNQTQAATIQQLEVSVADLPGGLYLFSIENGQDRYIEKFVKIE